MAEVRVVPPGGGEPVDLGPIRMQIVEDGSTTDHRLGVALIRVPAHTSGPAAAGTSDMTKAFYVVSGTATFATADATHTAPAGTLSSCCPAPSTPSENVPTRSACSSTRSHRILDAQYFRDLAQAAASGFLTGERILDVMRSYSTFLAGDAEATPLATDPARPGSHRGPPSLMELPPAIPSPGFGSVVDDLAGDRVQDQPWPCAGGRSKLNSHRGVGHRDRWLPMRPRLQLSSMKRMIEVWSVIGVVDEVGPRERRDDQQRQARAVAAAARRRRAAVAGAAVAGVSGRRRVDGLVHDRRNRRGRTSRRSRHRR